MGNSVFVIPSDATANGDNTYTLNDGSVIDDQGNVIHAAPGGTDAAPCACHKRAHYNMMHGMVNNHLLSLVFLVLIIMGGIYIFKKLTA